MDLIKTTRCFTTTRVFKIFQFSDIAEADSPSAPELPSEFASETETSPAGGDESTNAPTEASRRRRDALENMNKQIRDLEEKRTKLVETQAELLKKLEELTKESEYLTYF